MSASRLLKSLAIAGALSVGSCSTLELVERQFDASTPTAGKLLDVRYATRILLGKREGHSAQCQWQPTISKSGIGSDIAPTIAKFIAPLMGDAMFNLIDAAIKSQEASLNASYFGKGVGDLGSNQSACLIVVRGNFGTSSTDHNQGSQQVSFFDEQKLSRLGLVGSPDLYFEADLQHQTDRQKLQLTPVMFYFGKTAAKRVGSGTKDLYIFLGVDTSVSVSAPSSDSMGAQSAIAVFSLGRIAQGTGFKFTDESKDGDEYKNPFWDQTAVISYSGSGATMLRAQIYEMEKPGTLESALFKAYDTNGDQNLQNAINAIIKSITDGNRMPKSR